MYNLKKEIFYQSLSILRYIQELSYMDHQSLAKERNVEVEELIKTFGEKFPETAFKDVVNLSGCYIISVKGDHSHYVVNTKYAR
jgi:hypothetical protein